MISRRKLLAGVSATVGLAACQPAGGPGGGPAPSASATAAGSPASTLSPQPTATATATATATDTDTAEQEPEPEPAAVAGLPLTIVNESGRFANSAVWVYVLGTELATGRQGYAKADGTFAPCALSDNDADGGFTAYGIPLAGTGNTTIGLPKLSGRVYFSLGDKLKLKVVRDGNGAPAIAHPAGWVSADPNYPVLHDWIEFTYNDSGMYCNTTMVDQFAVPLAITLSGAREQTAGLLKDGARGRIFDALDAQAGHGGLVVPDLRVIAPGHGIEAGVFAADYFDPYISEVWTKYVSTDLTVVTGSATSVGRVDAGSGQLVFTRNGRQLAPIARPSTLDVYFCAGALAAPNDGVTGPVAAVLGAGFNRSTLRDTANQPATDPSTYYQVPITNHYARILHENSTDGKAYGFAFDDVADGAAYIQDTAPTGIRVTLTPF